MSGAPGQTVRELVRVDARVGELLRLEATAEGTDLRFQWRKDGASIPGATNALFGHSLFHPSESGVYDVIASNVLGSASSEPLILTVSPLLLTPLTATGALGENITLTLASGFGPDRPATYQWRRNGVNLVGATDASLFLTNVTDGNFGSYTVLITSSSEGFVTDPALLANAGEEATAPAIIVQPLDLTAKAGAALVLSAAASGSPAPKYQWKRDGEDVVGGTNATLWLGAAGTGSYTVEASNVAGVVISRTATVTLGNGSGRIANASSLSQFRAENTAIQLTGFVVSGTMPKNLLVRAVGPTLFNFGLSDALGDPVLEVFDGAGLRINGNDNWGGGGIADVAMIRSAGMAVGAYALAEESKDAALVINLNPGSYTLKTIDAGNRNGTTITEIYDLDLSRLNSGRLMNLSRSDSILRQSDGIVSGFVIDGGAATTLLLRAVGPSLRVFGVTNGLAQPQLTVFDHANRIVARSAAWESAGISQAIIAASARIGAFALPRGSADSCVIATLPPGSYTAQVKSAAIDDAGLVLFELYEVP